MFIALLVVESSDLLFAIDSLPAVIAVTADPFIAFSSNAFAILGLRSLYFVIAPMIARFHYMKQSLIFLLAFIGVKMLLTHHVEIPITVSLGVHRGILGGRGDRVAASAARRATPPPTPRSSISSCTAGCARRGAWWSGSSAPPCSRSASRWSCCRGPRWS